MRGRLLFRTCAVMFAIVLAAAGFEAGQLWSRSTDPSALLRATPYLAGLGSFLLLATAFVPGRWLDVTSRLWQSLTGPDSVRPCSPRVAILLFVVAAALFTASAVFSLRHPVDPSLDDQGAFLQLAREIQDDGGIRPLIRSLRSGEFREDNRHPLYPALLSVHPTESFGRLLSLAIAGVTGVFSTWLIARRYSLVTAGVFAVLLAANRSFVGYGTSIVCESTMTLWGGLAYFALLAPRAGNGQEPPRNRVARIFVAAILLGLMYLTKATGLLFFGGFLMWIIWTSWKTARLDTESQQSEGLKQLASPRLLVNLVVALLGFLVITFPLIERNIRRYGNPFHNVNSLLLFADGYGEFEEMLRTKMTTGETASRYMASHSLSDIVRREMSGLAWEAFIMLRALGPFGLDDARVLFGLPLALAALLSILSDRRSAPSLLAVWLIVSWGVFAWYVPIAAGDRFAIPLLIPVLAHSADGLMRLSLCWTNRSLKESQA